MCVSCLMVSWMYVVASVAAATVVFLCVSLLDEAKAVDDLVQVVVSVFPGLHCGFFTLRTKRNVLNYTEY